MGKPRQSDEERLVQFFTTVDASGATVLFRVIKGILANRGIDTAVKKAPGKKRKKEDAQLKIPGTPEAT